MNSAVTIEPAAPIRLAPTDAAASILEAADAPASRHTAIECA